MRVQHASRAEGADLLARPEILRLVRDFVRQRVPPSEVDDVVQTVLCEALAAPQRPHDYAALRPWIVGIARHKVADLHRAEALARRAAADVLPGTRAEPPVDETEARSLWRWVQAALPREGDSRETLAWLAREADGDKLEAIAVEHELPPARVRQRVSRLRRLLKARFALEMAAAAMLVCAALLLWRWRGDRVAQVPLLHPMRLTPPRIELPAPPPQLPEPPTPLEQAQALRRHALPLCTGVRWAECISMLDEAARLDPAGDRLPEIRNARLQARTWKAEELRRPSSFGTP